ncbi:hypothetical protein BHE74_00014468 [Ensete ventricosum]|nr:hypothetical protein BHE74_00014468 [Ensete ventricosum]
MAAAAARADGQEKVIAAAKHIVSSLATSKNAAEDMTRILSGFDNRLSTINDLFAPLQTAAAEALTSPRFSSASRPPRRWFFAGSPALRTLMSTLPPSIVSSPSLAELSTSTGAGAAEDEFRHLMVRNTVPLDSNDLCSSIRRLSLSFASDSVVADLKAIADRMIEAKYDREHHHAVKIVIRVLLWGERRLCDQILAASEELREERFAETTKGWCVMQLLNFGDAIAICQRSSEKLFLILDMYEALADVLPDLHALFAADPKDLICEEADGILNRLGDAVKGTLMEFGNAKGAISEANTGK